MHRELSRKSASLYVIALRLHPNEIVMVFASTVTYTTYTTIVIEWIVDTSSNEDGIGFSPEVS
jgi:hypothetical protein